MKKNKSYFSQINPMRNPITGEFLRAYIFEDDIGDRWEIVTDNETFVDHEEVLRKSEYAHNYHKGESRIENISFEKFCYSAYATKKAGKAFIARYF